MKMRKKLELETLDQNVMTFEQVVARVKKILIDNNRVVIFGAGILAGKVCGLLSIKEERSLRFFCR